MTLWLERKEKIQHHEKFIAWRLAGEPPPAVWQPPEIIHHQHLQMTKHPSWKRVTLDELEVDYGATSIRDALANYLVQLKNPSDMPMSRHQIEQAAQSFYLPFQSVAVYYKMKFWNRDPKGFTGVADVLDSVHVRPAYTNKKKKPIPGRFDTVLFRENVNLAGITGLRVAQVRAIFSIPKRLISKELPSHVDLPKHLAYVELFSSFGSVPDPNHGMYKVTRVLDGGQPLALIIPVTSVLRSVHLFPKFGPVASREWSSSSVLDDASSFYVNPWSDRSMYLVMS
jgi:hypothetical protein